MGNNTITDQIDIPTGGKPNGLEYPKEDGEYGNRRTRQEH